ncbi:hypothetical protein SO802_023916 [Lithocarpus litseifolius]|uniref:RNase H type-1 domain-containing protein n=1 Tax=Lithocarpus litseifolius TaxID=425828 RepID=A0AAW2C915_9ROSI
MGVLDSATCEACGMADETSGHLFWECTKARVVWLETGIPFDIQGVYYKDFIDFIWYLLFVQHVGQFRLAHLSRPHLKDHADTRWVPPFHLWYKVNSDAAVFANLKTIGIGVVIRDHEGAVIAALSKHLPLPLGPLEAEAKAMDEAVLFAWDVGIREAIFKTDSSMVSDAIAGHITPPVSIVDIIAGTLLRLQDFRRTQIQHVKHQANKPAHTLAFHAKGVSDFMTWIEECSPFVDSFFRTLCFSLLLIINKVFVFPIKKKGHGFRRTTFKTL